MAAAGSAAQPVEQLRGHPRRAGEASFFHVDPRFDAPAVKVLPGEFYVTDTDLVITTTQDSCIAACVWDAELRVRGINHFLLPDGGGQAASARYGDLAMDPLITQLLQRGASRAAMKAKVFGGDAVVSASGTNKKIRVMVVDDSALVRSLRAEIINQQSDMCCVGAAADPLIARDMIRDLNPDVITLDVEMPRMDGLEFLGRLMRLRPTPVVFGMPREAIAHGAVHEVLPLARLAPRLPEWLRTHSGATSTRV